MPLIPIVVERDGRGERAYDIFSMLLNNRIILLGDEINDHTANVVIAQLLHLSHVDPEETIQMYIQSPGGVVYHGLAIYDAMQIVKCDVTTYCVGQAASMAAILLAAGAKGKRFALANSRVMIHQPWGGFHGTASDISIQAEEILKYKKKLNEQLAKHTGQPFERVEKDTDRDRFMSAEEAKAYGLVDEILTTS